MSFWSPTVGILNPYGAIDVRHKCAACAHNCRPVVSESGLHFVCVLSARAAMNCLRGKKDRYTPAAKSRRVEFREDDG